MHTNWYWEETTLSVQDHPFPPSLNIRPKSTDNKCYWKIKRNQRSIPTRDLTRFADQCSIAITTMNPHPALDQVFHYHHEPSPLYRYPAATDLNYSFNWMRTERSPRLVVYVNLLTPFLPLIPFHPLHHKSSSSRNVKQIMTSFGLWGPMGERLLIRSSTLTSKPPLDLRSLHLLHNTKVHPPYYY